MPEFIVTQAQPQPHHLTEVAHNSTEDGELLRLVAELQTLIRGAQPEVLARLGTQRLTAFKAAVEKEQAAIRNAAQQVKLAINSSLSVDELTRLGMAKLQELGATAGVRVAAGCGLGEYAGYSLNSFLDSPKA